MASFSITFSYKGKAISVPNISYESTKAQVLALARHHLEVCDDILLKLLYKGKIIAQDVSEDDDQPAFTTNGKIPSSGAKIIVMGTEAKGIQILNSRRSDPLLRGFDDKTPPKIEPTSYWGQHGKQDAQFKFCRLKECTDASFGSRPGTSTPHAFEARRLLERLSTDPGIVAIITSRELVVGTLGEIDPIDDRLMQKKQQEGACLLGYNTNHGMRIDVKLRSDDLSTFRPYSELASTLIHELSHNWVGEHNVLFWTNYAQMRVEYLWKHALLLLGEDFVNGKRTAELAGVMSMISGDKKGLSNASDKSQLMENICKSVMAETAREMAQHRIPVELITSSVLNFCQDLMEETKHSNTGGQRLGGSKSSEPISARELAFAAADKRAKDEKNGGEKR